MDESTFALKSMNTKNEEFLTEFDRKIQNFSPQPS